MRSRGTRSAGRARARLGLLLAPLLLAGLSPLPPAGAEEPEPVDIPGGGPPPRPAGGGGGRGGGPPRGPRRGGPRGGGAGRAPPRGR
ncbi:hypothetical protein, partial [Nocardia wallacei]|uniref:hypothetical protein n=1 Tax=Nocardia wallacei TaxID=480035 RepID=UPI002458955F